MGGHFHKTDSERGNSSRTRSRPSSTVEFRAKIILKDDPEGELALIQNIGGCDRLVSRPMANRLLPTNGSSAKAFRP
ncbi:Hypothetical protein NTJ_13360 [Nesidiocoris tenuis]|uniref:Uncharacterized protein n=1 Tax=Nesidiocoris tenuis TaxID=355587 RepID=A0ABN7B833_9HEMI|nr:Hypothetical protein NTJ_13360 [Nesidiocoris tenuis]